MKRLLHTIAAIILALLYTASADGMSQDTTVSLVTFYPGPDIYELEGHTVLRITTPYNDTAISYGMFDFDSPGFVYRFIKGETDYAVGEIPWLYMQQEYTAQGRRIVEHKLNLSATEKAKLLALLGENLRPENRVYRYNYVRDNCATRPVSMIETAMGDTIAFGKPDSPLDGPEVSWRTMMRYYHARYPWYQLGIDLVLGPGIDRPATTRQRIFAPASLVQQIRTATINGKPLVINTVVLNDVPANNALMPETPWWLSPLFVCWLFFIIAVAITWRDVKHRNVSRWFDSLYFGLSGVAGCVVIFLVFVSSHEATSPNPLALWLNPIGLFIVLTEWTKNSATTLARWLQIVNFALILAMIAWLILSGMSLNPAIAPLIAVSAMRSMSYILITRHVSS